jgi:hypothetical protein
VQLATAPFLAVSGNSPIFLGHRLLEEARISLYKQSVDDRPGTGPRRQVSRTALGTGWLRGGALDLFTERPVASARPACAQRAAAGLPG